MSEKIRINKFLSDAGVCSRREADRLIEEGRVTVNGKTAVPGEKTDGGDCVFIDGKPVKKEERKVLLLFYKPKGIVCSTKQQREETTVTQYLHYPLRIYPVGRLDKESEGLLLLTNQGDLVNKIMKAGNFHEKEYIVKTNKPFPDDFIKKMGKGVPILETVTRPCFVERMGKDCFRIILTQGLNRQIRRMCEYFGYQVVSLKRVRIMNLTLSGLEKGEYREITEKEWKELDQMLIGSANQTAPGGNYGKKDAANERTCGTAEQRRKSVLSGRQRNHEQPGIRPSLRPAGKSGKRNGNRSGKQSHGKRRV